MGAGGAGSLARLLALLSVMVVAVLVASGVVLAQLSSLPVFLAKWGSYGMGDGQFINPESVVADSSDSVFEKLRRAIANNNYSKRGFRR